MQSNLSSRDISIQSNLSSGDISISEKVSLTLILCVFFNLQNLIYNSFYVKQFIFVLPMGSQLRLHLYCNFLHLYVTHCLYTI